MCGVTCDFDNKQYPRLAQLTCGYEICKTQISPLFNLTLDKTFVKFSFQTFGIQFYIWKFGVDQALLDCVILCQCPEKKNEKKVQQVTLFQPFFTQVSVGNEQTKERKKERKKE